MKYGRRLKYECVVEWEDKYISYVALKKLLASLEHPNPSERSPILIQSSQEDVFFDRLHAEFAKINEFFQLKQRELQDYYAKLTETANLVVSEVPVRPSKVAQLKTAFMEFYRGLCMLQNYIELNYEGFVKILKKYDKQMKTAEKEKYTAILKEQVFYSNRAWKQMMESVENLYVKVFKVEKRSVARVHLTPSRTVDTTASNMFKLGTAIGVCFTLAIASMLILFNATDMHHDDWHRFISVIPVYRAVAVPLLAVWFWGVNVYIWSHSRINYVFIFGLDPRTSLDHKRIFKSASILTAVWLASFFLFIGTVTDKLTFFSLRAEFYPLVLVSIVLALLLFPFRAFHRKSRSSLYATLGSVLIAPFGDTKFRALYVGDVLTSLVKTLSDTEYTICYFVTGDFLQNYGNRCQAVNAVALPVLSGLPLFLRLMQCLKRYYLTRHNANLGNAGKYSVACSVVVFGALHGFQKFPEPWTPLRIIWFICYVSATLYNITWDITMDWGLGKPSYLLLRKRLLYRPHVWAYYWVLLSNIVMRFAWTLYISPVSINIGINPEFFASILAVVEIYRRFQWSVFRIEWEQIVNTGESRAHVLAPLPGDANEKKTLLPSNIEKLPLLSPTSDGTRPNTPAMDYVAVNTDGSKRSGRHSEWTASSISNSLSSSVMNNLGHLTGFGAGSVGSVGTGGSVSMGPKPQEESMEPANKNQNSGRSVASRPFLRSISGEFPKEADIDKLTQDILRD